MIARLETQVIDAYKDALHYRGEDPLGLAPSCCHAIASLLEGCSYNGGSPQNTLVLGITTLATTTAATQLAPNCIVFDIFSMSAIRSATWTSFRSSWVASCAS